MYCKVFSCGGGSAGGIGYLVGGCDAEGQPREPPAEVLRGNPALTQQIIAGLNFSRKYTSGVLSFAEPVRVIERDRLEQIMDRFEDMVFAGLPRDRAHILWVLHQDKGRAELHWVIPNVDLETGKRFQPYYHRADLNRFRAFERLINAEFNLADPSDPARRRSLTLPSNLPVQKAEQHKAIDEVITALVKQGHIQSRNDVTKTLEAAGYTITRQGQDYLTIQDTEGKKLRLRGAFYGAGFTSIASLERATATPPERGRAERENRLHELRAALERQLERRRAFVESRYCRDAEAVAVGHAATLADLAARGDGDLRRDLGLGAVAPTPSQPGPAGAGRDAGRDRADHGRVLGESGRAEPPAPAVTAEEITDDPLGNPLGELVEYLQRGILTARAALDRAVERCQRALGEHDAVLSRLTAAGGRLVATIGQLERGAHQMSKNRADELERFKREINLSELAAAYGYTLDPKLSSRAYAVMRGGEDEKLVITRGANGHYVYANAHNETDRGSVIDFLQRRSGQNLGQVRKTLRPWLGESSFPIAPFKRPAPEQYQVGIEQTSADIERTVAAWLAATPVRDFGYLKERGLSYTTVEQFAGSIRQDQRGNILFRHVDRAGVCGFEVKNERFTGFSAGGEKGLWIGAIGKRVDRVVIAESAIDAMSYAQLYPADNTLYVSFGGSWSGKQQDLIRGLLAKNAQAEFVIATDADGLGHQYAEAIRQLAPAGTKLHRHGPEHGKDWNEQLQYQPCQLERQLER